MTLKIDMDLATVTIILMEIMNQISQIIRIKISIYLRIILHQIIISHQVNI
jgi:hypothetical protein